MEDKILHVETASKGCEMTWAGAFKASKHEALLLTYEQDVDVDYLYNITERIEEKYSELIAFWSHPIEGDNNTPKPCVIVQDRELLTDLRKKIGFENE
jgi:hypothetical protein